MFGSFWFLGLVCILSVAAAVGGLWLVRRSVSHETLMNHHDVAGAMLSIIGTLFAVVLGLVVVGSLNKFDQARQVVEHEANSLRDLFSLSSGLPEPANRIIRQHCIDYASTVSTEEWALMEKCEHSKKADSILTDLNSDITHFRPVSNGESNLQQSLLEEIDSLEDSRASRTVLASPPFDPIIWSVLITGGIVLVVFTYFFGVESFKVQASMTALVTVVLVLNMIVVAMFAYPFSGDVKVWPVAFQADLRIFQAGMPQTEAPMHHGL